jgi:F0F1-type ATP synthase epsilon subunit
MFDLTIIGETRVVFSDTASSLFLDGENTEYEFLSFHADTVGILRKGNIVIDNQYKIPVRGGVAVFRDNKCLVLVQE